MLMALMKMRWFSFIHILKSGNKVSKSIMSTTLLEKLFQECLRDRCLVLFFLISIIHINDIFSFIKEATLYNYADENTLAFFSRSLFDLITVLEKESINALDWLEQNEMIANPNKFHALFIEKDQTDTCGINLNFQGHSIKSEETVKLLGITLDYEFNFDTHTSNLCKKAAAQLNVLKRLKSFIGFTEKETLVQSFVYSNFNYCPFVWYFSPSKSVQKIERTQERVLRFLYNDNNSS